ncbi:MAG: NRDE family protein [Candidatus Methylacidiphilales bacterium]
MCSVTFIPRPNGFIIAMNRDEQRTRAQGLPPALDETGDALFPSEPGGGTWIGINRSGVAFTLLNWYSVPWSRPATGSISRGEIIPALLGQVMSLDAMHDAWDAIPLRSHQPFRLVAYFLGEKALQEWQWDGKRLYCLPCAWQVNHWFSSGKNEPEVQAERMRTARVAWSMTGAGNLPWLRELHASHLPGRGPLSICMHREDACTVSSTELAIEAGTARMTYIPGAPCECSSKRWTSATLQLNQPASPASPAARCGRFTHPHAA